MLKKLLQAATITFLLNLLVYISPQDATQSRAVFPSHTASKIVLSLH
jgi:hypothetical protein